jgi:hypothetical protein
MNDADEMEQALKRQAPNYVVDKIEENKAVYPAVRKRLTEAAELAKGDATLLFFFAGHGGQTNTANNTSRLTRPRLMNRRNVDSRSTRSNA